MERCRLIFEGLDRHANVDSIVRYLKTALKIEDYRIRRILTRPPGVFIENDTRETIEKFVKSLDKMGCRIKIEPIITYPSVPFAISDRDEKLIKKEMSKVLRAQTLSVIYLIHIRPVPPDYLLPSMMGPIRETIEGCFRDSDTVIGIDDCRLVVLCFATDRKGALVVGKIIDRAFKDLFLENVHVSSGFSTFPEDGKTLSELLTIANINCEGINGKLVKVPEIFKNFHDDVINLRLCFTKARGKLFRRLMDMDAETLWVGLGLLSKPEQLEFLARLPYDCLLLPVLKNKIEQGLAPSIDDKLSRFEAIIHQLELEEKMRSLDEIRNEVLLKLNRVEDLPIMPSVAAIIFKITSNPESPVDSLVELIESDSQLKSKLLQTVNSAFYGSVRKIATVKQSIVLLGMEKIRDLAFGLAAEKVFDIQVSDKMIDHRFLWNHSVITALIAQDLCKNLPEYKNIGVFAAGLLHDFGKIFFMQHFPVQYRKIYGNISGPAPIFELEEEELGLNHAIAGKCLSINWGLSEPLVQAIAYHHYPHMASTYSNLAAIVGLADYLYYKVFVVPKLKNKSKDKDKDWRYSVFLSYGHFLYLREVFPGLNKDGLKKIADTVCELISNNTELITTLGRGGVK